MTPAASRPCLQGPAVMTLWVPEMVAPVAHSGEGRLLPGLQSVPKHPLMKLVLPRMTVQASGRTWLRPDETCPTLDVRSGSFDG